MRKDDTVIHYIFSISNFLNQQVKILNTFLITSRRKIQLLFYLCKISSRFKRPRADC